MQTSCVIKMALQKRQQQQLNNVFMRQNDAVILLSNLGPLDKLGLPIFNVELVNAQVSKILGLDLVLGS